MTECAEPLDPLLEKFNSGSIFVYPTEAVYGIGCDPENEDAVTKVLALKNRPVEKGLILIADTYSRVFKYVNDAMIPMDRRAEIFSSWPGPNTWLMPKSESAPSWITGQFDSIAVRVTAHEGVKALCERFDSALVSTSANLSGQDPAMTLEQAKAQFGTDVEYVEGPLGGLGSPSIIRDAMTGNIIRG